MIANLITNGVGGIINGVGSIIDDIHTSDEEVMRANLEFSKLHHDEVVAQIETNKEEAKHSSLFVAGWRPFIGWVGGFSLAYAAIIHPLLIWIFSVLAATGVIPTDVVPPPYIDSGLLMPVVTGMLGIGAMRSYDKKSGVMTNFLD